MEAYHSVAVIGAGVAGLYAARLLRSQFPDIVVLEAQNRVGGRIKQLNGMAPWPIEMGPEFVHGSNSVFVEYARKMGVQFQEKGWPDWWYFAQQRQLVHDEEVDDEVDKVHDLFDGVENVPHPPPGTDVSAADWLKQQGASAKQLAVADACYANDFGCSLQQLGLREMIEENKGWDSGETYLLMDRSMGEFIKDLQQGLAIHTNWPVQSIQYSPQGAIITSADGRKVRCKKVVITVPLRVLQDKDITFSPPLPSAKQSAIQRIRMGNVVKIICSFKKQFWPNNMYDVVCTDSFVPEMWMLKYPSTNPGQGSPHCIVGFVAGERANAISNMEDKLAIQKFVDQLDSMFGGRQVDGQQNGRTPASSSLIRAEVVDWSKERYVKAAYTYPTLGAELGDRQALGAPVAGTLFFAGEACHPACNPCIQGAMETAARAAKEVAAATAPLPRSKL